MKSANNYLKLVCFIIDVRRFSPAKKKQFCVSSREVALGF